MKIVDYEHGIVSVISAVRNHIGLPVYHRCDEEIIKWLNDYQFQQVIIMLIDGMGAYQIKQHCDELGFLKTYYAKTLDTIYPPTTVAATTSILTGKQPCETGWLGWQQYFSDIDQNLEMFMNQDYYTMKKRNDRYSYEKLPIKTMIEEANEMKIPAVELFPYWKNHGAENFEELCDHVVRESKTKEHKLVYAYWDGYDSFMHQHGESAKESVEMLRDFDLILKKTMKHLHKDTGLIIIADHGHIDVKCKYLKNYPDIVECFRHLPALEPRTLAFYIKEDKKDIFKKLFLHYFKDDFKLFTKQEILSNHLFGNGINHDDFESFLGDFIACAISDVNLVLDESYFLNGAHAGMSKEEIEIPLILYSRK